MNIYQHREKEIAYLDTSSGVIKIDKEGNEWVLQVAYREAIWIPLLLEGTATCLSQEPKCDQ